MSKLTLDALKSKADAVASNDLLATISGGNENDCHTIEPDYSTPGDGSATHFLELGDAIRDWIMN